MAEQPKRKCDPIQCWTVQLICPKTLHTHTKACEDKNGNRKCGMFEHPSHDMGPFGDCGRSVKTCGH